PHDARWWTVLPVTTAGAIPSGAEVPIHRGNAKILPDSARITSMRNVMRLYRHFILAAAIVAGAAAPARADGFIAPFAGFTFGGDVASTCQSLTNCEEKRMAWGVAFGTTR